MRPLCLRLFGFAALPLCLSFPALARKGAEGAATEASSEAAEHRTKGQAAAEAGHDEEAAAELRRAVALDPSDEVASHELGKILFRQGRVDEAIARFQIAVKLKPSDALAWYNLAYASRKAQQSAQAAAAYERYTALQPDDPDGYFGLAESLRQAGKIPQAVAAYQTYTRKETRPSEQRWVERSKERIAELQKMVPKGEEASASPPGTPATVVTADPAGLPDPLPPSTAVAPASAPAPAATPAIATDAGSEVARAKLAEGDRAFAARDFRSALFAYQDALQAQPASLEARLRVAEAYSRLGHDDDAIEQWQQVLVQDPLSTAARQSIAAALARKAELARSGAARAPAAAPPPARAVARAPAAAPATPPFATPSLAPGGTAPASAATDAPQPAVGESHSAGLASVAAAAALEDARRRYAAAVKLEQEAAAAPAGEEKARRYRAALAELDRALVARPAYAVALVARGSAKVGLGQMQEAIADYSAARTADPSLASPLFGLAEAYRGLGNNGKAAELYRAFASSSAPDAQAELKQYALKRAQALSPR